MNSVGSSVEVYDGSDINLTHINSDQKFGAIFVTFAARSSDGNGTPFGFNFFKKHNIETFFITQKRTNHWWHTPEMEEVARIILSKRSDCGLSKKKVVLYGSSMGGYAACHLRNLFHADVAIAIAPQIFIDNNVLKEARWPLDVNAVQGCLQFNEVTNIANQSGDLYVFYDPLHELDNAHVETFRKYKSIEVNERLVEVPFASHDLARLLSQTKTIQNLLLGLDSTGLVDTSLLNCSKLYLEDYKAFFNYFRNASLPEDRHEYDRVVTKLHQYLELEETMDFESMYMAAESLAKLTSYDRALALMKKSISNYRDRFNREPPNFLNLKLKAIQSKAGYPES